jgi:hypothetical protein
MELAEGGTVADVVQRDGAWPEARAVAEVAKLLGAIDKLHGSGALHRDITPYNVFACGDADRAQARRLRPHHPRPAQGRRGRRVPAVVRRPGDPRGAAHALGRARGPVAGGAGARGAADRQGRAHPRRRHPDPALLEGHARGARAGDRRSGEPLRRRAGDGRGAQGPGRRRPRPRARRARSLSGRNVVFTGRLGIPRETAAALARKAGASVSTTFTPGPTCWSSAPRACGPPATRAAASCSRPRPSARAADASTTSPSSGSCASSASAERLVYLMLFTQLIIRHSLSSASWAPPCGIGRRRRPGPWPAGRAACRGRSSRRSSRG